MHAPAALHRAKLRAARRASEDGGVIFVVAMTMAVLAAIGVWAMQSAATEVRTAGYERQNTQTHYVSQYGVYIAMMGMNPGLGQVFMTHATTSPDSCISAPTSGVATPNRFLKACTHISGSSSIGTLMATAVQGSTSTLSNPIQGYGGDAGTTTPGSLGTIPMQADFWAEYSDFASHPCPGFDTNSQNNTKPSCYSVTVTSGGLTQQQASNATALWGSEGLELQRVRVLAGPL